jgi:Flp pilus assembly protein TadG
MTIRNSIHRFLADEDATATVEFVIVFPVLLMVFISAFETAMILTRQVMLERAVDSTVRYLRLTSGISVTHDQIRQNICDNALLVTSRTVVWLFLKQFRFECVPVLHSLQGRLAA